MKKIGWALAVGLSIAQPSWAAENIQPSAQVVESDEAIIQTLYRNSYTYWQMVRNDNGSYNDLYPLDGKSKVGSIANSGMGLVALTIGHINGWEPEAEKLVIKSLKVLTGKDPDFSVPRNDNNTYIHFYNVETGKAIGDDWSPIDSAIMLSGALFAKRYFHNNQEIADLVDELYETTDLRSFIADYRTGHIYLAAHKDGSFKRHKTKVFNEYMIVADLARQQEEDFGNMGSDAIRFWDTWYDTLKYTPISYYGKIPVLSAGRSRFISMFNFQFNNYLVHHFSDSQMYQKATRYAAMADFQWWQDQGIESRETYEWGSGAGACSTGYCVDRIALPGDKDLNLEKIASPHIVSGFLPHLERARTDLIAMYRDPDKRAHYQLKDGSTILWRYSTTNPEWRADNIQAVDYSTMLFGLAALPENLGMEFFNTFNDYFNPEPADYRKPLPTISETTTAAR
ncbi:hypothetical protein [Endozoicomonas elysicola]|nr:hypothetical protein [Endozoicomonas elysicola]